jgi:FAD/FMN-containing dehydrogenase
MLIAQFQGDGNIHLHAIAEKFDKKVLKQIEPYIFQWVANHHGSISAEHGLGFQKKNYIGYTKSKVAVKMMKMLKSNLDPNCILNPYKVLPLNE